MAIEGQALSGDSWGVYTGRIFNRSYSVSGRTILAFVVVVAVLLRITSALYQGNSVSDLPGVYDQISYDGLARRVVDGYGFSFAEGHWPATRAGEPTAHWSYLYTLYLALIYKIFGFYPVIARVVQALIGGIFQTVLVRRIGVRLFNRTVGLIAAAMSAVYIYFFYYAGALITETFYIMCILWTIDASFRIVDSNLESPKEKNGIHWLRWLELGLAIGLTVLLRQVFMLFLPFLFIWMWWNIRSSEDRNWKKILHWTALRGLFMVSAVFALMIVPFTIRNYRAFGTFVLLNTNAGFAFYWGNHPIHGTHFMPLLPDPGPSYQSLIPPDMLVLNEGELDKALLQKGIQIVLGDPLRYLKLSLSRVEEYFKFWPSRDSSLLSNLSRVGSFGILLPFMLFGVWISFSKFHAPVHRHQRPYILIIYLFVLIYTSIHLLSWTLIRYRLPIDAFLLMFGGLGVDALFLKAVINKQRDTKELNKGIL